MNWRVGGISDINMDGRADIVWVSASSLVAGNFLLDASGGSSSQLAQLVQAMAGFGGGSGAAESLDTTGLGADASQQSFLATPQHA
jgi:hypothetical protein